MTIHESTFAQVSVDTNLLSIIQTAALITLQYVAQYTSVLAARNYALQPNHHLRRCLISARVQKPSYSIAQQLLLLLQLSGIQTLVRMIDVNKLDLPVSAR
jgi:hypothetical protein